MRSTDIGAKLIAARLSSKLTQEQVAQSLGVSRQTVSNWERGVPKLKDTTLKPTLTLLPNNTILEVNPMKRLISCEYNFDNCCVELKFTDGSIIAIDTIAVENEVADNMYQRSELDWLIYNKPLEYAQLIFSGELEMYIKDNSEHRLID